MKANIIRIGNSQGIRIPKVLLEQSGLATEVDLQVKGDSIVITSASHPREGWGEKFKLMAEAGDDRMPDEDLDGQSEWDKDEWVW